jgi:hypothetical protein
MPSIGDYVKKDEVEGLPDLEVMEQEAETVEEAHTTKSGGINLSFLSAKTGEGSIEEYVDHPLNWNTSRPVAQILRGFTGLFGSLEYALVDIAIGAFRLNKGRKAGVMP